MNNSLLLLLMAGIFEFAWVLLPINPEIKVPVFVLSLLLIARMLYVHWTVPEIRSGSWPRRRRW
jgi:hypothetical protein